MLLQQRLVNSCKKIFEFGQREVISFFTLVTNKGEHSNMRQATCLKDEVLKFQ